MSNGGIINIMQKILEDFRDSSAGKRFFKARRDKLGSPNLPTQSKKFSPGSTPNFPQSNDCEFSQSTQQADPELSDSEPNTPSTVVKPAIQVSGKRGQLSEGIKVLKYYKNSESSLIPQKSLALTDSLGIIEIFSVYDEENYLSNSKVLHFEHDVDDYDTTVTQMRLCKDMLEQELKEAFLELGIDN